MRIALLGDFDTFLFRGVERPISRSYYRLSPGLNLARGFTELGVRDIHYLVVTPEVDELTVDEGPFGTLHRIPNPRGSGSATFFLWRRHLILKELARIQPDIVHGQGTEAECAFTAVTSPYPHVITFHGIMHRVHQITPPPLFSLSHVPRWMEKIVVRKVQNVISISQDVEDFLRESKSPARSYRIPNAMAPCFFGVEPAPREDGRYAILYVGEIQQRKGLIYLVEALARLRDSFPDSLVLRVIGPSKDSYKQAVEQRATELKVDRQIEWLGTQREQVVAEVLARSDLLALPSFWENMPMSIGEALAAGVPVVSTSVAGIPDWVDHGKTGLLVKPGDPVELADAIRVLLQDSALRHSMGTAGRARALAAYAPRVVAKKTLEVYETICQGKRSESPRN
jgi:glycosyltransferase involved in cell wall biosynthesis